MSEQQHHQRQQREDDTEELQVGWFILCVVFWCEYQKN
jgi:hypothetical protein